MTHAAQQWVKAWWSAMWIFYVIFNKQRGPGCQIWRWIWNTKCSYCKCISHQLSGHVPPCNSASMCIQPCVSAQCQEKGFIKFIRTAILIPLKKSLGLSLTVFVSVSMTTAVSFELLCPPVWWVSDQCSGLKCKYRRKHYSEITYLKQWIFLLRKRWMSLKFVCKRSRSAYPSNRGRIFLHSRTKTWPWFCEISKWNK